MVRVIFLEPIILYFFHQWLINNQGSHLVDPCLPAVWDLSSTDKIKDKKAKGWEAAETHLLLGSLRILRLLMAAAFWHQIKWYDRITMEYLKTTSMADRNLRLLVSVISQHQDSWWTQTRMFPSYFLQQTPKKALAQQHLLSQVVGIFINKKMVEYPSRTERCHKMGSGPYLIINYEEPSQIGFQQAKAQQYSNSLPLLCFMVQAAILVFHLKPLSLQAWQISTPYCLETHRTQIHTLSNYRTLSRQNAQWEKMG